MQYLLESSLIINSNTWFIPGLISLIVFSVMIGLHLPSLHAKQMLSISWMLLVYFAVYLSSVAVFPRLHHFCSSRTVSGLNSELKFFQLILRSGSHCQVGETSLILHTCCRSDQAGEDVNVVLTGSLHQVPLPDLNLALWTAAHSIRKTVVYSTFWATDERIFYYTI